MHILDGLLKNRSQLQPDTLHADTQGQSEPVFGLSRFLGITLMPRMRTWADVAFYRPSGSARYRHIDPLFTREIDWTLIETHWQDMMQVVLSGRPVTHPRGRPYRLLPGDRHRQGRTQPRQDLPPVTAAQLD